MTNPSPARGLVFAEDLTNEDVTALEASLIGLGEPSDAQCLEPIAFVPWCRTTESRRPA
jgi:hypothetical protein